eukprot:CAMPEP_0177403646 /NCGR_PEP_ID=MMETSP0368-20130122/60967_1 /TAXON_ID=447022 ORGANISM="Scrippsiella hangoei-like, Strain SHHI-4" /NCGR_SAMPLE_ID=MMETSP0368 /ASSEMBLY_ACC=CAM_ASM_000363 /LENGTH=199 /DNA_ID=CAMNT_0018871653 /DNA_START=78 /DNA_END=679 /DNA_ORIENTATION=-
MTTNTSKFAKPAAFNHHHIVDQLTGSAISISRKHPRSFPNSSLHDEDGGPPPGRDLGPLFDMQSRVVVGACEEPLEGGATHDLSRWTCSNKMSILQQHDAVELVQPRGRGLHGHDASAPLHAAALQSSAKIREAVGISTDAKGSSISTTSAVSAYAARAKATRARCPLDSPMPLDPTDTWSPPGKVWRSGASAATCKDL